MAEDLKTRRTLLARAKDLNDNLAWNDFAGYYAGFIRMVLCKMHVPQSEYDDLNQEILLKIWKGIQSFDTDNDKARFRTWLSVVIRNVIIQYMRSYRLREQREEGHDEITDPHTLESHYEERLEKIINEEWEQYMAEKVLEHLRKFFSGKAIDVFLLSTLGKSSEEISRELNVPLNTVYVLRNRVKVRFMDELKTLRTIIEF